MWRIWSYRVRVRKEFETFGKRGPATPPSGQGLAGELPSRQCNHCLKCLIGNFWRCKCCKLVNYCNRQCQRSDWPHHKALCTAISNREFKHSEAPQDNRQEVFMSHLTPKEHEKLIKLVGRRCTIKGKLNGKTVEILWDTGAQVSIISNKYLEEHFSDCKIKDVSELLNCDLALTAANGSTIPYEGWVELNFQVGESENILPVPFLVVREIVELPLVGYNVIEHLIKSKELKCNGISSNFVGMDVSQAPALVEFISSVTRDELCPVRTVGQNIM